VIDPAVLFEFGILLVLLFIAAGIAGTITELMRRK